MIMKKHAIFKFLKQFYQDTKLRFRFLINTTAKIRIRTGLLVIARNVCMQGPAYKILKINISFPDGPCISIKINIDFFKFNNFYLSQMHSQGIANLYDIMNIY